MPFSSLGDLLKKQTRRTPYAHGLSASRVAHVVRSWIVVTWDTAALEYVRACYMRDGILHLGVSSASFAEALRWRDAELRAEVHRAIPNRTVQGIHIFVGG